MLKLKELRNKVYEDRQCFSFEYVLRDEEKDEEMFVARFVAKSNTRREWRMQIVLDRTRDADSQVYTFGFVMPRSGLPLELIAATGLKYFQLYVKEEVQQKSNIDFMLGSILEGM